MNKSSEDYLEAILILKEKNGYVRGVDIAKELNFSKPSVSRAVATLSKMGYTTYDENGMILLTDSGKEIAKSIYDRHMFLKNFLINIGVEESIANNEACKIEHDISNETFLKFKEAFPQFE